MGNSQTAADTATLSPEPTLARQPRRSRSPSSSSNSGSSSSEDETSPCPSSADVFAALGDEPEHFRRFVRRAQRQWDLSRLRNADGDVPLAAAIRRNSAQTVGILLAAGVSTNSAGLKTPFLSLAAEQRNSEIVSMLLKHGAMPYMTDAKGYNPLHLAAEAGDFKCLELILGKCDKEQIEGKTLDKGETPLHIAVRHGFADIVSALVARHAPVHLIDHVQGCTALHIACRRGDIASATVLLDAGAPVNATDFDGNTIVHDAARCGSIQLVKALLAKGAILQARNCDGNTVLHVAVLSKMPVAQLLELVRLCPSDAVVPNRIHLSPLDMAREVYATAYDAMCAAAPPTTPRRSMKREFAIHFTSDIHLEFGKAPDIKPTAPYLALLGDTCLLVERHGVDHLQKLCELLDAVSRQFQRVFIVMGNHEFYHNEVGRAVATMQALAAARPNIEFLNRRSVVVDGVRLVGATLWSAIPPQHHRLVPLFFNDYKLVSRGTEPLTVADTTGWHAEDRAFIAGEIEAARAAGQKVVVLTHHAPLWQCGAGPAESYFDPITHATANDMSDLMGPPVAAWLYGHSHWFQDMTVRGTRVASNPHGYPQDGTMYDPRFCVSFPIDQ